MSFGAHGPIFFIVVIVLDNGRQGPIDRLHHSNFYRTKSQRTRTDFHSDFLSTTKKVCVRWALGMPFVCYYFLPSLQNKVERSQVCVEGGGRISRSGLTQDINMGSCVFQCDVPHQWIAQRQVDPVYCDRIGCHVLCLQHDIRVWQHIGQSTTATSRHRRDMTSDV